MKILTLCLLAFFCLSPVYSNQGSSFQEKDEITATIEQLLNEAEESIHKVNFDQALTQLNTALELSRSIGHQRHVAFSSSLLAHLYYVRQDFEKAATEIQRAIAIQRNINDQNGLAFSYVNYAKIFNSKGNLERATQYLDLATNIYSELDDAEGLGIVDLNRAIVMLNLQDDPGKALQLLNRAEENLAGSGQRYELSRIYYYKARAHLELEEPETALQTASHCLMLSREHKFGSMIMSSAELISVAYEKIGNYDQSLQYLQMSNLVRDSLYNLNREALASEATARYGVDSMKNALNELSIQNKEQERSLKVNKLTTILSVALITILSLLTLSLYKNNNLRARANDLLQKKNSELVTAKENAEKASLAKAQFLSTITHELRTPLYAVTGLTHLLLEESPTENQKEHLNSLKFSGEYLLSLINNILDLNKLEAKKVEMMDTSFNLERRISDVLIALKNSAEDKNTHLHLDFEKNIPGKLKGDPLKISQILINLVGNSIKFTENGDIWVRVKKIRENGSEVLLQFEVEDNGEGISMEKQKAIFENFTQGSLQINRKFGGTGLGLSIVKNLLTLMNSQIHLESELDKGSKFYFQLTFEAVQAAPVQQDTKAEPVETPGKEVLHDKKILIVEDNKINQMITRKILEKHKVTCDVADNGRAAIEKVKDREFDLILMDIHMPGISGIEATTEIRKFNQHIPIVALTAVTLDENLDDFYLNGFSDIIPKPYKTDEFFHKITKYLSQEKTTV